MPTIREGFAHEKVLIFAIVQLIQGLTAMILSVVLVATGSFLYFYGTGIWTGLIFIVAGAIGVFSARKKDDCTIIAFMVTSIIAIVGAMCLLGFGAVGISQDTHIPPRFHKYVYYEHSRLILLHALMLIVSVIEALAAAYSAILCCRAVCCGRHRLVNGETIPNQVQYLSQDMNGRGGQQVMIITAGYPGSQCGYSGGQVMYMAAPYVTPQGVVYPGPIVDPHNAAPSGLTPVTPPVVQTTAGLPTDVPQYNTPSAHPPAYSTMERNTSQNTGTTSTETGEISSNTPSQSATQIANNGENERIENNHNEHIQTEIPRSN